MIDAVEPPRPRRFRTEEVVYLHLGRERLLATLYLPEGEGPFIALLDVHGGAWMYGDRLRNVALHEALARQGIAIFAIDFRQAPAVRYPAPIADINFALRWLKVNGPRWNIAPELVSAMGSSSGGHQLMLATMRPRDPRYLAHSPPSQWDDAVDATVRCAVLCWPVTDPVARFAMARELHIERLLDAHDAYWPNEASMAEGSPQGILEAGEELCLPPTLVIQGTMDENLTPDMADRFAAAFHRSGGSIRLEKFDGEPHMFINVDPSSEASKAAISKIANFVLQPSGIVTV